MATTTFSKKPLVLDGADTPTLARPATENSFARKPKLASGKSRKRDIPEGLWTKCPKCESMVFDKELDDNLKVCPKCQHHFAISARERIHSLVETCSFEEMDAEMTSVDVLQFTGVATYKDKLEAYQRTTGLEGCRRPPASGRSAHFRVALGVMDFALPRRLHGIGGGRETHPPDRGRHRQRVAGDHHFHQRRRAHVRRHVQPHADGQDQRRARVSRQSRPALHQRADPSDHGGGHGQLCSRSAISSSPNPAP